MSVGFSPSPLLFPVNKRADSASKISVRRPSRCCGVLWHRMYLVVAEGKGFLFHLRGQKYMFFINCMVTHFHNKVLTAKVKAKTNSIACS